MSHTLSHFLFAYIHCSLISQSALGSPCQWWHHDSVFPLMDSTANPQLISSTQHVCVCVCVCVCVLLPGVSFFFFVTIRILSAFHTCVFVFLSFLTDTSTAQMFVFLCVRVTEGESTSVPLSESIPFWHDHVRLAVAVVISPVDTTRFW